MDEIKWPEKMEILPDLTSYRYGKRTAAAIHMRNEAIDLCAAAVREAVSINNIHSILYDKAKLRTEVAHRAATAIRESILAELGLEGEK